MEERALRIKPDTSHSPVRPSRSPRSRLVCSVKHIGFRCTVPALFALAVGLVSTGCVERRMTIRTNLDNQGGALAIVDGQEVGVTPVSTGFTYYGDRKIRLIKDGYETVTLIQPIRAPWWDSLPLELFVENLWPLTLRDEREFQYALPPQLSVTTDEVLQRAHQLRTEGQLQAEPVSDGAGASSNTLNF